MGVCSRGLMEAASFSDRERELVKEKLLVRYEDVFDRLLDRVKEILLIDERGHIHLRVPRDKLTHAHLIALELLGRKFAHTIELASTDTMSTEDIVGATKVGYKSATARISELKSRGWIESDEEGHRIVYMSVEDLLNEVESRLED